MEPSESNVYRDLHERIDQICVSCGDLIESEEGYCARCGVPTSGMTSLDPMEAIRAEAFVVEKATETLRPKPIVLFGMWMTFLPFIIIGAIMTVDVSLNQRGLPAFFFFWVGVGLFAIGIVVLFKVTRNYFQK